LTKRQFGKFITVEGCEGVGKSTQTRLLKEYCQREGVDAYFTREPGGTPVAERIRGLILDGANTGMDAFCELLLYEAARRQHTRELILPLLKSGKTVFCDRYIDSTLAYQGYARGLSGAKIRTLNEWASDGAPIALTLFLDADPVAGFIRKGGADKTDRLEAEGAEFHKRVYEGFLRLAADNPRRVVKIDASGTKEETHGKIVAVLKQKGIF
jgi:dTMP kinase